MRDHARVEILDIDGRQSLQLHPFWLRIAPERQPDGPDLPGRSPNPHWLKTDPRGQRFDPQLRFDIELERIRLRRIDRDVQLVRLRIEPPNPHRPILHIPHGKSVWHVEIQLSHAPLRRPDRDPVETVYDSRPGDIKVRDLREKLRYLRRDIAPLRVEVDDRPLRRSECDDRPALIHRQSRRWKDADRRRRGEFPARLVHENRQLLDRRRPSRQMNSIGKIRRRHLECCMRGQHPVGPGRHEIRRAPSPLHLGNMQPGALKSRQDRRGIQQLEIITLRSPHPQVQLSIQSALRDIPCLDDRFDRCRIILKRDHRALRRRVDMRRPAAQNPKRCRRQDQRRNRRPANRSMSCEPARCCQPSAKSRDEHCEKHPRSPAHKEQDRSPALRQQTDAHHHRTQRDQPCPPSAARKPHQQRIAKRGHARDYRRHAPPRGHLAPFRQVRHIHSRRLARWDHCCHVREAVAVRASFECRAHGHDDGNRDRQHAYQQSQGDFPAVSVQ